MKKQKTKLKENLENENKLYYELNQSELSIIAPLMDQKSQFCEEKIEKLNQIEDEWFSNKDQNSKFHQQNSRDQISKYNKSRSYRGKQFQEDEDESFYLQQQPHSRISTQTRSQISQNPQTQLKQLSSFANKHVYHSDDESDCFNINPVNEKSAYFDDTYNLVDRYTNVKVNYFNILVIGKSHSGKFNFIEFMFDKCFKRNLHIDSEVKEFREFTHKIQNGRRGCKIINFVHSKGYQDSTKMKKWYKNIKQYIYDRSERYEEMRKYFLKEKNLKEENLQDTRIHLCLYFIKSQKIPFSEMLYLQKLQKIVNIVPILVEETHKKKFDFECIKLNARNQLLENNIEWFDLQDDDLTFKQFRKSLLAQTTPFLISVKNDKICFKSVHSDIYTLAKMLMTPYVNTYYYKTELITKRINEKIENKKKKEFKQQKSLDHSASQNNLSLGIAVGIGFLGAIVAVKNKIFQLISKFNNFIKKRQFFLQIILIKILVFLQKMITQTQRNFFNSSETREKSSTWCPRLDDRFIPNRKSTNASEFTLHTLEEFFDLESSGDEKETTYRKYSQILKANFSNLQINDKKKFLNFTNIIQTQQSDTQKKQKKSKLVSYAKKPIQILEIPGMEDNYYHNILSWSSKNYIAVVLANQVFVMNKEANTVDKIYEAYDCEEVTSLDWNSDGTQLVVGNILGEITIWDVNKKIDIHSYQTHQSRVGTINWQDQILSGSQDKKICITDFRCSLPKVQKFQSHSQEVCQVKWSPQNNLFASGGNDGKMYVWSTKSQMPLMKGTHEGCVKALDWSHKQQGILFSGGGTEDKKIKIWNISEKKLVQERKTNSQICSIVASKLSNDLFVGLGHPNFYINVYRAKGLKKITSFKGHKERVLYLQLSNNGEELASATADESLRFWNVSLKKKQEQKNLSNEKFSVSSTLRQQLIFSFTKQKIILKFFMFFIYKNQVNIYSKKFIHYTNNINSFTTFFNPNFNSFHQYSHFSSLIKIKINLFLKDII